MMFKVLQARWQANAVHYRQAYLSMFGRLLQQFVMHFIKFNYESRLNKFVAGIHWQLITDVALIP